MGFAGAAAKIATKPGVLGAIPRGGWRYWCYGFTWGRRLYETNHAEHERRNDLQRLIHLPTHTYDYSIAYSDDDRCRFSFASIDPGMSGGVESRIIPTISTTTDAGASAGATTGTGMDLVTIGIIGAVALGGVFLLSGGLKK